MSRQRWLFGLLAVLLVASLSHGYVRNTNHRGNEHYWQQKHATMTFRLGCANAHRIEEWGPCWDDVAEHAMDEWNDAGSQFQFTAATGPSTARLSCAGADTTRVVVWGATLCGQPISALALTSTWTHDNGEIADTDVVFNTYWQWEAYSGPMRAFSQPDLHRVAVHEFGHVLGLDHPNDYGQHVPAIMNNGAGIEGVQPDDIAGIRAIYGTATRTVTTKGALGNPGHRSFKSGIGVVSGWVCDAQKIEVQIGRTRYRAVYGSDRPDTAYAPDGEKICGDTNNGFVILFNYNSLGDGTHTARLLVNGRQHGEPVEFKVTTFGQEFLRGAQGAYTVLDFPRSGTNPILIWDQNAQNFMIGGFE